MGAAANRYARALMDVLYPDKAEAGLQQLRTFNSLLNDQPDARRIFENPTFAGERRKKLLQETTGTLGFDKYVANFVNILVERNRLSILNEIIDAYQKLLEDRLGIVRSHVTSSHPLDANQKDELAAKLQKMTGKQVRMEVSVDPTLIGGVVAQVGSVIYDGSVRQQLQAFKDRLVQD